MQHLPEDWMTAELPEIEWDHEDDLCDCTFQRIGWWTNPYIGKTMRIRWCCIWNELGKQFPQYVELLPGFYNYNEGRYEAEPWEWDGEADMPRAIWYRQIQSITGRSLPEIRERFKEMAPPKGTK